MTEIRIEDLGGSSVKVTADYQTLVRFHDVWQSSLWPNWKADVNNSVAITQVEDSIADWIQGEGVFGCSDKDHLKAVRIAAAECDIKCPV